MGQNLLPAVVPVNARAVWRQHVTSLVDTALARNDAVLEDVGAAIARTVLSGGQVYAFGAGHSISLVNEMYRRAGSFRALRPIWNAELTSIQHSTAVPPTPGLPRLLDIADHVPDVWASASSGPVAAGPMPEGGQ